MHSNPLSAALLALAASCGASVLIDSHSEAVPGEDGSESISDSGPSAQGSIVVHRASASANAECSAVSVGGCGGGMCGGMAG